MDDSLYEKDRVKITYLHSLEPGKENEIISGEDHELWLGKEDGEWDKYIIPRGVLKELARTVRDKDGHGLISKLDAINLLIIKDIARKKNLFRGCYFSIFNGLSKRRERF